MFNKIVNKRVVKGYEEKGDGLYAELSTDIHNFHIFCLFVMIFCTESGNGCLLMVLKGFFANIGMKPKINVKGCQGVVKLFKHTC